MQHLNCAAESTSFDTAVIISDGSRVLVSVGHAFELVSGEIGVVLEMGSNVLDPGAIGTITKWRLLYNQAAFDKLYPGAIAALRPFYVVETNECRSDHVSPNQVKRVFLNRAAPLVQAQDVAGTGDVFTVGQAKIDFVGNKPLAVCGLAAPSADELVRSVHIEQKLWGEKDPKKWRNPIAAQIEDGIVEAAWSRNEELKRVLGSIELRGIPAALLFRFCMRLLATKVIMQRRAKVAYQ